MTSINFWPILGASVAGFAISALWYSPVLFGKEWLSLARMTAADIAEARARGIATYYLIQFVSTLVMFIVMGFAAISAGALSAGDGAFVGFLAWIGFVIPTKMGVLLWRKEPFKLFLIDAINYFLVLIVGGAIIGAWN